jgi:SAM-dependent methyltransferase
MNLALSIAHQFRQPTGLWGRLAGAFMIKGNGPMYDAAIPLLDIKPTHRILEIGYGPGTGLPRLLATVPQGSVAGIDFSETMFRSTRRKFRKAIKSGILDLRHGDVVSDALDGKQFDAIIAVNVIYFWPDPVVALSKIRSLLAPAGRLALVFAEREELHKIPFTRTSVFNAFTGDGVTALCRTAGLKGVALTRQGRCSVVVGE